MLSFAVRRLVAVVPTLLVFALCAALAAVASGPGWADTLLAALVGLPVTAVLVLPALALGTLTGALFGLTASLRPGSVAGRLGALLGGAGPALPAFLLAAAFATLARSGPATLVLAWTALTVPPAAQAARLAREALDAELSGASGGGVILAARGRGLGDRMILWHHAVLLGVAAVGAGLRAAVAATVTGAVAVEGLFGLPGAGRLFLAGARAGDAGNAVAALAGLCGLAVLLGAAGAVLHGWLDPRARRP